MNDYPKIKLGISTCLLGENVRYNGSHKLDHFLVDTLGRYVTYVPVCPEVECGLGVPRESMRLVGEPAKPRLVTTTTKIDKTDQMLAWAARKLDVLAGEELCGFIFKSDSPSSGMERVKVYNVKGVPVRTGIGLFARAFMERFPLLPVEEEGRLHDLALRENFIESIFTLKRWRDQVIAHPAPKALIDFHAAHKLLIMAHSPEQYRQMGAMVAGVTRHNLSERCAGYQGLMLKALRLKATPGKHVNVMMHIAGYFKEQLSPADKQELLDLIANYRAGTLPLVVPITLLQHYARVHGTDYLRNQVYLAPNPLELQLRNHA